MSQTLTLDATVEYGDVDRRERMLLPRLFKLLQEAAIAHANQFGAGTNALVRAETWFLNRMAVEITRYPHAGEALRVETWSTGIQSFKGYRDFRVADADGNLIVFASSVWLYLSLKSQRIIRVPRDIADAFPAGSGTPWCPDLEDRTFEPPPAGSRIMPMTLRYSDYDVNEHVNNAAYLDLVQTALASAGRHPYPRRTSLHFMKAIPAGLDRVDVRLADEGPPTRFSISRDAATFAIGAADGAA